MTNNETISSAVFILSTLEIVSANPALHLDRCILLQSYSQHLTTFTRFPAKVSGSPYRGSPGLSTIKKTAAKIRTGGSGIQKQTSIKQNYRMIKTLTNNL